MNTFRDPATLTHQELIAEHADAVSDLVDSVRTLTGLSEALTHLEAVSQELRARLDKQP